MISSSSGDLDTKYYLLPNRPSSTLLKEGITCQTQMINHNSVTIAQVRE